MAHKYVEKFYNHQYLFDQFLNDKEQRNNLYEALDALKKLHTERNVAVYDALNDQTAGMIEIAEKVTSIYDKIDTMNISTAQLKEECKVLKERCDEVASTFHKCCTMWLVKSDLERGQASAILFNKMYPHLKTNANDTNLIDANIEIERLERLVYDYSMQITYLQLINDGLPIGEIESMRVSEFEKSILDVLKNKFIDSFNNNDTLVLKQCLVMYDLLNKQRDCEKMFIQIFVAPNLSLIFNEQNMNKGHDDVESLYKEALHFVNTKMITIMKILNESPEIQKFNFILHCFWYEAHQMLKNNLPLLTSAGNPELFHKRYIQTIQFLKTIALMCNTLDIFNTDPTFAEHMKMFDLNVYYEIRHQKITGIIEKDILQYSSILTNNFQANNEQFHLKVTKTLWDLLAMCFDIDGFVFLEPLTEQFLRLSMLLICRYRQWILDMIAEHKGQINQNWELFLVLVISDINQMKLLIGPNQALESSIYKNLNDLVIQSKFNDILNTNGSKFDLIYENVKIELISMKLKESGPYLNEVTSIPRLYRRTNKSAPKTNSTYIAQTTSKVLIFNNTHKSILNDDINEIIDGIIVELTEQYLILVNDVINSVGKTEKSLRRLKNRNTGGNQSDDSHSNVTSDESKIREQIKLDVAFFINEITPIAFTNGKVALNKLTEFWSGN